MKDKTDKQLFRNNFIAVLLMYIVKASSKITVGILSGSSALIADGVHNIYDIVQFIAISITYRFSKESNEKYPIGRDALESVVAIIIGVSLISVGFDFLREGLLKLLNLFGYIDLIGSALNFDLSFLKVEDVPLPDMSFLMIITVLVSAILSFFVYKYESKVADELESSSLEGDAEELKVDMFIELSLFLAFVISKLYSFKYADPIFTVLIGILPMHAGYELIKEKTLNLLNKAIDSKYRDHIFSTLIGISGVESKSQDIAETFKAYIPRSEEHTSELQSH